MKFWLIIITASKIIGILSSKDWRKTKISFSQLSYKSCQRWTALIIFLTDFLINFTLQGFNRILVRWLRRPRHQLKDGLFLSVFDVLLVEFICMLWVILNFDSSVKRTLFHCSVATSLCTLAHWILLILFCFFNSGFLAATLPYRSASLFSPFSGCLHIFPRH